MNLPEGSREVAVGIAGWKVRVGKKGAVTDKHGNYTIHNVPAGETTVLLSFMGAVANTQQIAIGLGHRPTTLY